MAAGKDIGYVDAALQKLGPFKTYTLVQFSMQIFSQFAVATFILSIVFTGQQNPFYCPAPDSGNVSNTDQLLSNQSATNISNINSSQPIYNSLCYTTVHSPDPRIPPTIFKCTSQDVKYELPKKLYFVSEFDLVCEREAFSGLTQTLLTLGHSVGSLFFPYFADNYGRKPILLICSILWFGSSLGLAFSVNYTMLAICKTLVGIFLQGVSQTGVTVMMEVLTGKQRGQMFGSLAFIFWTLSIMLMSPIAYLMREYTWRYLELAYCTYFIFIALYILFMDESLRWLAANGLKDRVMYVLKKASRWNGLNFEEVVEAFYKGSETDTCKSEKKVLPYSIDNKVQTNASNDKNDAIKTAPEEKKMPDCTLENSKDGDVKLNCCSLFKNKYLRQSTLFSMCSWFFNSLTYYALFLMSSSLSGSLYLNYFLNSVVELPSAIFLYFCIDRLGRKICFVGFSIIAGLSLVAAAGVSGLFYDQKVAIKVLTILGKFGISGSFGIIYTLTPELFPTTIRTTGLGLANLCACIGGMLAPFAGLLMHKAVYAPGLIFGISSLILSVWTFFLHETARRQLPQSVRDIQGWVEERKCKKNKSARITDDSEDKSHVNYAFTESLA